MITLTWIGLPWGLEASGVRCIVGMAVELHIMYVIALPFVYLWRECVG